METKDFVLGFAAGKAQGGGGGDEPTGTIEISTNGTHNVKRYASAAVDVPNSYSASDEGKVVNNGALVAQTARALQIIQNGTYDTTLNNEVTVNVSGSNNECLVFISDNPSNDSRNLSPFIIEPDIYSYIFLLADNYGTDVSIGGKPHYYADIVIDTGWNTDIVYAFLDTAESLNIAMQKGDSGNHICTILALTDEFSVAYNQTVSRANTISITIDTALSEAYVLFLLCIYNGDTAVQIEFMGETIEVNRYASRYAASSYCFARKLTNVQANTVVDITVNATAGDVQGIMGIFGNP